MRSISFSAYNMIPGWIYPSGDIDWFHRSHIHHRHVPYCPYLCYRAREPIIAYLSGSIPTRNSAIILVRDILVNTHGIKTGCTDFASNSCFSRFRPVESRNALPNADSLFCAVSMWKFPRLVSMCTTGILCYFLRFVIRYADSNSSIRKLYRL